MTDDPIVRAARRDYLNHDITLEELIERVYRAGQVSGGLSYGPAVERRVSEAMLESMARGCRE